MIEPQRMVELWRGDLLESYHSGHAVVCDGTGGIVRAWGDPDAVIYPRSSCKMMQALPMIEAGVSLSTERMALACASHQGAPIHVSLVRDWLKDMDLDDGDLLCGTEVSRDTELRLQMIRDRERPCQVHNNCSGKHAGFLTFARHLEAGPDYVDLDHPVQRAVRDAHETLTELESPGYGIDGCSAPNFATTVHGLARAMAAFATAREGADTRSDAMARLRDAMALHPDLVAGEGRACTALMRAAGGGMVVKTGAEAVFVAILPEQGLGVALKIVDGATRASEAAIAAILADLGVLDPASPAVQRYLDTPLLNRAGLVVGHTRRAQHFPN